MLLNAYNTHIHIQNLAIARIEYLTIPVPTDSDRETYRRKEQRRNRKYNRSEMKRVYKLYICIGNYVWIVSLPGGERGFGD